MKQFMLCCLLLSIITLRVGQTKVIRPVNQWSGVSTPITYCGMINAKIFSVDLSGDSRKGLNLYFSKFTKVIVLNGLRFKITSVDCDRLSLEKI